MLFNTRRALIAATALSQMASAMDLKPITDPSELIPGHPSRRQAPGNKVFDPQGEHTFFWGDQYDDDIFLANFTLQAPGDNEMIIPIESFADRLKSIKCDTNAIVIEFNSQDCYDYASGVWGWVNDKTENAFTLVTKAGQCDPDDERDPYSVTDIKFDKTGLKATLEAKRQTWQEAAKNFQLQVGHQEAPAGQRTKRFSIPNPIDELKDAAKKAEEAAKKKLEEAKKAAEEAAKKVTEEAKKKAEEAKQAAEKLKKEAEEKAKQLADALAVGVSKSVPMDLSKQFNQNLFDFGKDKYGMKIKADAQVKTGGKLIADIDVKVKNFAPEYMRMKVHPKGLHATLMLALTADGRLGKEIVFELPAIEVPVAGINLKGLVSLGPKVHLGVNFGTTALEGTATASIGAKASIPDSSVINIDALKKEGNNLSGWKPSMEKIDPQFSAEIRGGVTAYVDLSLMLEASIADKWGIQAQVESQVPYIEAGFKAEVNTLGVCGGKQTKGVELDANVGINVNLNAGMVNKDPIFSKDLYNTHWPLFSTCMGFGASDARTGTIATAGGRTTDKASKPTGKATGAATTKDADNTAKPTGSAKPSDSAKATGSVKPTGSEKPTGTDKAVTGTAKPTGSAKTTASGKAVTTQSGSKAVSTLVTGYDTASPSASAKSSAMDSVYTAISSFTTLTVKSSASGSGSVASGSLSTLVSTITSTAEPTETGTEGGEGPGGGNGGGYVGTISFTSQANTTFVTATRPATSSIYFS
ncbi:hypothetical protein K469DRAFT_751568 [Zopfia rhizophila CBS 207.26]|uniref:Uncharacterized protein n=1 Tax=Zopfia rhizophila CBS 207.26 TaxID=1314779 RepID=A0A6A6DU99_9PEZI|nr:hypothetical protein K469DRAFT_751568 [Zopfia rhizophila CBS 207.26]